MHPLMQAAGHRLLTPTYTGLGERAHLAHQGLDLETHIQDILNVIKYEDLRDIVLLGHSYGGMVATGVADRARDRVAQLIYIDAFVPGDGQSLFDLNESGRARIRRRRQRTAMAGACRRCRRRRTRRPPMSNGSAARRVQMPIKCFETAAQAAERSADLAAQLHLRHADHAGRYVRAVFAHDQKRSGLALFRDRRQPFAERHRAGGADGVAGEDRGVMIFTVIPGRIEDANPDAQLRIGKFGCCGSEFCFAAPE